MHLTHTHEQKEQSRKQASTHPLLEAWADFRISQRTHRHSADLWTGKRRQVYGSRVDYRHKEVNLMNNHTATSNQRLTLISKNGGIHVGWVEVTQASTAPTQSIQLEIDFNQSTTNNK